jgi:fructokinase
MAGPIIGLGEILWDLLPTGPRAGGAPFNFAFHCHQLGHEAVIVSRVGDDDLGGSLRAEVRRLGMTDEFIQVDPDHPTGTVEVELDDRGQPNFTIADNVAWDYLAWEERFKPLIRSARAVCFGTLAQRCPVSRRTVQSFIRLDAPNWIVVFDVNLRSPFVDEEIIGQSLVSSNWLKLNEGELDTLATLFGLRSAGIGALAVIRTVGLSLACVTRGERGCTGFFDGEWLEVPGIPINVADTVGAGDAFTAGLLTQMLEGKPLAQAARFANTFAAIVASRPGGTPRVERAEVERLC